MDRSIRATPLTRWLGSFALATIASFLLFHCSAPEPSDNSHSDAGVAQAEADTGGISVAAPDESAIQVLVLGSYHFGNPGQDVHNMEADSVLTERRQRELEALNEALTDFSPTVVAVERVTSDATTPIFADPQYIDFEPAVLAAEADERHQIGYRLAHSLGLEHVFGIDEQPSEGEPDYFPFGKVMAHVEATGRTDEFSALNATIGKVVKEFEEAQKTESIPTLLLELNNGMLGNSEGSYSLLTFDYGEQQPGAELAAYWFMRNAKIFAKLQDVSKPGDRVVVVYGGGHKYWLEHFAENTPGFVRVDPTPYLVAAADGLNSAD